VTTPHPNDPITPANVATLPPGTVAFWGFRGDRALTATKRGPDNEGFYGGRVCEPCCDCMAAVSASHCGEGDEDGPDPHDAMDARWALRRTEGK
jgi:hypothetical protein